MYHANLFKLEFKPRDRAIPDVMFPKGGLEEDKLLVDEELRRVSNTRFTAWFRIRSPLEWQQTCRLRSLAHMVGPFFLESSERLSPCLTCLGTGLFPMSWIQLNGLLKHARLNLVRRNSPADGVRRIEWYGAALFPHCDRYLQFTLCHLRVVIDRWRGTSFEWEPLGLVQAGEGGKASDPGKGRRLYIV